jgi:tRNA (guanosine-2'-O-)-methyltransferase
LAHRLESVTLVAEATHLRHNLSAIIRTAESFGLSDVHLISNERKKISGAAKGAEKWVTMNIYQTTKQCLDLLKRRGYTIWIADLQEDVKTPETLPIEGKVAIVMGTELSGVSDIAKEMADGAVIIPMYGLSQSLNVSVASACLLQRLSTRKREFLGQDGDMSPERQAELLAQWIERDEKEKVRRQGRVLGHPKE